MNILNNKNCFITYDDKLTYDESHLREWIINEYIDNHGSSQQKLSFIKKLLLKVDHLKESTSKTTYLPTKKLITNNRKDLLNLLSKNDDLYLLDNNTHAICHDLKKN